MMTPVEQFQNPRQTEIDVADRLVAHTYLSATLELHGKPGIHSHNLVSIRLRLAEFDRADDLFLMLTGWDHFERPSYQPPNSPDTDVSAFAWQDPCIKICLEKEWTHGLHSDSGNGTCYWVISDANVTLKTCGAMFFWDTYETEYPGWFWRDGVRPPLRHSAG